MTRTPSRAAAIAGAALALLLAGCSADDGQGVAPAGSPTAADPSPSPSPSPSASRVVVKPERPAAMDDDGPAGAEAAAVYFLELDSYMQATGDTAEWEAMSHRSCEYCAERAEQASELAHGGYRWTGGEVEVDVTHTYMQDDSTGIWPIDATVHQRAAVVVDASGTVVSRIAQGVGERRVEVARVKGRWVFVEAGDIPKRS